MINDDIQIYKSIRDYNNKIKKFPKEVLVTVNSLDYKRGYIYRYFLRKRNDINSKIIEIDKNQWLYFKNDHFYITVDIKWLISGDKDYVYQSNLKIIEYAELELKGIKNLLGLNPLQFYKN